MVMCVCWRGGGHGDVSVGGWGGHRDMCVLGGGWTW